MGEWKADPIRFVRDNFGVVPDDWQADVLRNFPRKQRIAMRACKGPGKTAVLAWLIWNFIATRPHPKIAATSISGDNLADCLWTELAKWQAKSPLLSTLFEWSQTKITSRDYPQTWWASARTWSRTADRSSQSNTLAGLHADYLLFVLDESGDIPDAVMATAEAGLATGIETKIVQAGNPTNLDGPLYRACTTERHLWHVVEITGDPDDPKRSKRIDPEWARDQIEKYGRDNPWVLVNVFGKFPPSSMNTLLGPDDCTAAMGRHIRNEQYDHEAKVLGVDVARFGDDRTVITLRQGRAVFPFQIMRGATTPEIAARVARIWNDWNADACFIDDTGGWAAGVIDFLRQSGHNPIPVNFSGKPGDPRYYNKRAEIWFEMAEWVKTGGALPPVPELQRELTAPTYEFHNGKFQLEDKEQIKTRLGYSPDIADSVALTFSSPVVPSKRKQRRRDSRRSRDYDPFEADGREYDPFA